MRNLPFSKREPDLYQATFVLRTGSGEDRWFVARRAEKWRIDNFENGRVTRSQIFNDRLYSVDSVGHKCTSPPGYALTPPPDSTANFFRGTDYHRFEQIRDDADRTVYRVVPDEKLRDEVTLEIDKRSGLIVRQTLAGPDGTTVVWEALDLSLEVDDSVFAVPAECTNTGTPSARPSR